MSDSVEFSASARDPLAPDSVTTGVFPAKARRYRAFISYSHADTPWANWLLKKLEGYRVPARFHGRAAPVGEVGPRLAPVFRDRDELPTTSDLGETIRAALRESATLIVICSPSSAKSRWVQEEIVAFKRLHGERRVFALIVAGEPKAEGTADDCFSPALRRELAPDGTLTGPRAEVVAADARAHADGKSTAFVRLVAGLLGVGFDELRQRELQRRNRRLTLIAAASFAGMVLTLGLALAAWRARGDAQRRQDQAEDVLAFMLGDFREDLKKVGQLALLEKVGNKAMGYFDALNAGDLTDTALARQAKALTQIGEVRLAQRDVRYTEAARAFFSAYQRAAALAARHPQNGDMLFERGQSEYWIGAVYLRHRDLAAAREWMRRYRDTGAALVALDPASARWQGELAYGHRNLAVIDMDQGNTAAARTGFRAELAMLDRLRADGPGSVELQHRLTDVHSWLGRAAEQDGDFEEARERFAEQVIGLEKLVRTDAGTARWKVRLADALAIEASLLSVIGRKGDAVERRARARALIEPLVAQDATNRTWLGASLNLKLKEAISLHSDGDETAGGRLAAEARAGFEKMHKAEPSDRTITGLVATALRVEAEIGRRVNPARADETVSRALGLSRTLVEEVHANDLQLGDYVKCCLVAGEIAESAGDRALALRHWIAGWEGAKPRLGKSANWRLLDPAARVMTALGRTDESRAIIERLTGQGYRPLTPWP